MLVIFSITNDCNTAFLIKCQGIKVFYKVQALEKGGSNSETETTVHAISGPNTKPWNPPAGLKFPCPMTGHKHEVSKCGEFFDLSPEDRREKLEKEIMCFSCLKPKTVCSSRKCTNHPNVPKVLKCTLCTSWAESKGLAPFSIFFCKGKEHGDPRAPVNELKSALEKYIWKLGTGIAESNIVFAVNFM